MPLVAGGTAPYAPPATVIEVLTRYRERGMTTPFTTEVLERAGVSDTLSRRTMQALKLLGFVDSEGMPTPELETATRAPDADYKQHIGDMVVGAYMEVMSFADPTSDSYERVRDAFRVYNPRGQQDRMVTLFLGLMEFAGLDVSAATASRKKTDPTKATRAPAAKKAAERNPKPDSKRTRRDEPGDDEHRDDQDEAGLPPGLVGLLRQIPRGGTGWPRSRRDEFLAAFTAVLDFSVPVRETEPVLATTKEDA